MQATVYFCQAYEETAEGPKQPSAKQLTTWSKSDNQEEVRMVQKILNKFVGAKYMSLLRMWVPNLTAWGAVGGLALVHFTDWRLVLDYVPYISGKFKSDE